MKQKLKWKLTDPVVSILAVLLVFVCGGVFLAGCNEEQLPTKIYVEVDAAYGGDNPGNQGIINEADFNENVVNALEERLQDDDRFVVLRTHEASVSASVANTSSKINRDTPDIVISIHAAFNPDPEVHGMRIFAELPTSQYHDRSLSLAKEIQKQFTGSEIDYLYYEQIDEEKYQMVVVPFDDTEKRELETWTIMEKTNVPVVVSEQIYITNQDDVDTWANEEGYQKAADQYYEALCSYYQIDPKERKAKE